MTASPTEVRLHAGSPLACRGTVIVVGAAPCVFEDVVLAKRLRPGAELMALNEAGGAFRHIAHLYAGHHDKAAQFLAYRVGKGLPAHGFPIHACWAPKRKMPACVTHQWSGAATGGTSALTAARIGLALGYGEVILAGCPLEATGYFNEAETDAMEHDGCPRVGRGGKLDMYRKRFLADLANRGRAGLYSMSGWTREQLGAPT